MTVSAGHGGRAEAEQIDTSQTRGVKAGWREGLGEAQKGLSRRAPWKKPLQLRL